MKRIASAFIFLFLCICLYPQSTGSILREPSGGFLFQIPEDWKIVEYPSLKYRVAIGSLSNGFLPNINVVDEEFAGNLNSYVQSNIVNLKKYFSSLLILSQEDFKTKSGVEVKKIAAQVKQRENMLFLSFYMFKGNRGRYLVITCSVLLSQKETYQSVFDACIRTLELF